MHNHMSRRIGAHVPVRGGLAKGGLARADEVGARVIQIFLSNPRGWARSAGDPRQDQAFRAGCAERDLPSYAHAPYLVNLAAAPGDIADKSVGALAHSLVRAAAVGALGVVVHAGSVPADDDRAGALRGVRERLMPVLDQIPDGGPRVLIEPTAGGGRALAARLDDLPPYLDALDWHPRVGVCLDTCHLYAAGHDIATEAGMRATFDQASHLLGADRLGLVHANDSRDPLGSGRDRHETIGEGRIGADAFRGLLTHPATAGVPAVVETPDKYHAKDIARLTELATGASTGRRG